jgi:hypothetical protein
MNHVFTVDRRDLRHAEWQRHESRPLGQGAVRMHVDSFALTANNVTYAAFGEAMHYWDFFPTGDEKSGCIPVWGFATVTETRCPGIAAGERWYGYLPMAEEVVLEPLQVDESGFADGAAHRRALHGIYNRYLRCSADPLHRDDREAEEALLRPLFTTSFLIDDFLLDNGCFGARSVVLSSASSKTAYGTAFCLSRRRGGTGAVEVVGLTSPENAAFARRLGCYDRVLTYEALSMLPPDVPTVYVDMSGSTAVRAAIHAHLGEALRYDCSVGGTHWEELGSGRGLPGPRPVLFFAPEQSRKRRSEWGADVLAQRIADAWQAFMVPVSQGKERWLHVVHRSGRASIGEAYQSLLAGRVSAQDGLFLSP